MKIITIKKILSSFAGLVAVAAYGSVASGAIIYTTVDDTAGSSVFTQLYGVNDFGIVTGIYQPGGAGITTDNAFTDSGGTFTSVNCPTSTCTGAVASEAPGINNAGVIVGTYVVGLNDSFAGYMLSSGTYSTFVVNSGDCSPSCGAASGVNKGTLGQGINSSGDIVGTYSLSTGTEGFYFNGTSFQPIAVAGVTYDALNAINNSGEIGGDLCSGAPCATNPAQFGFTESTAGGTVTCYAAGTIGTISGCSSWVSLGVTGASDTTITGIDGAGDIVGNFVLAGITEGFLYNQGTGTTMVITPTSVGDPAATKVQIFGINNLGNEIVGSYTDASGTNGLIGQIVPEPGTLALTFSSIGLVALWGRKRRFARP